MQQNIQWFVKDVKHLILEVLRSHCVAKHKINKRESFAKLSGDVPRAYKGFPRYLSEGKNSIASTANIRVPSTDDDRTKTRHVLTPRRMHALGRGMGPSALKNQHPWWRLIHDILLVLLLQAEGHLHRDSSFLLAFDLV